MFRFTTTPTFFNIVTAQKLFCCDEETVKNNFTVFKSNRIRLQTSDGTWSSNEVKMPSINVDVEKVISPTAFLKEVFEPFDFNVCIYQMGDPNYELEKLGDFNGEADVVVAYCRNCFMTAAQLNDIDTDGAQYWFRFSSVKSDFITNFTEFLNSDEVLGKLVIESQNGAIRSKFFKKEEAKTIFNNYFTHFLNLSKPKKSARSVVPHKRPRPRYFGQAEEEPSKKIQKTEEEEEFDESDLLSPEEVDELVAEF